MRTDGRTDMTELVVAFRNFANAPRTSHLMLFVLEIYTKYMNTLIGENAQFFNVKPGGM